MAVLDSTHQLGLSALTGEQRYRELARALFLDGEPTLRGSLPVRVFDSLVLRSLGLMLSLGQRQPGVEQEYQRLTSNFDRVGKVGAALGRLGLPGRVLVRALMSLLANLVVRQGVFDVRVGSNALEAAAGYFTIADRLGFEMEVHSVDGERVAFSFLRCPAGYTAGQCVRTCMATNKWDRECVRALGARMVIDELIPEGAAACRGYIVPADERVPEQWRRYPRGKV